MASRESAFAAGDSDAARNTDGSFNDSSRGRPLDPVFASAPSKPLFASGVSSMMSFGAVGGEKGSRNWFYQDEGMDEYLDECFGQPEKKRRLSLDQIHFLERTFEADNKLEPERKMQLAKELGLQPRQIAIWFQNRRARWKSRQLENDYEALRSSYDSLKANYENLIRENDNLKIEVHGLRCHGHANRADQENLPLHNAMMTPQETLSEDGESRVSAAAMKNEEQSSGKSDVTDVETMTNWACKALEFNESGMPQNGENDSNEQLPLPDYSFPRMEDAHCHIPSSSFYYGFLAEDPGFGFWPS